MTTKSTHTKSMPAIKFLFIAITFLTANLVAPKTSADINACSDLEKNLNGTWLGEASKTVSVTKNNQDVQLTCTWDLTLDFNVRFERMEGQACAFNAGGSMDIEHRELQAESSNKAAKAGRYCSWSDNVPLNYHNLLVSAVDAERKDAEFTLEFSFEYTRGTEFDITMYVFKNVEHELVKLTPDNRIILEAGELQKKEP